MHFYLVTEQDIDRKRKRNRNRRTRFTLQEIKEEKKTRKATKERQPFIQSFIHWFIHWFIHTFTQTFIHSLEMTLFETNHVLQHAFSIHFLLIISSFCTSLLLLEIALGYVSYKNTKFSLPFIWTKLEFTSEFFYNIFI